MEIEIWVEVTELAKDKMGIAVAISLLENELTAIWQQIKMEDVRKDWGLKTLIALMEKKLGKDGMEDNLEKYEEFKNCRREQDQKVGDYIHEFEQKYKNKVTRRSFVLNFWEMPTLQNQKKHANLKKKKKWVYLTKQRNLWKKFKEVCFK